MDPRTSREFDAGLARRGLPPAASELISLDERRRAAITREAAQARRNAASREIGLAKANREEPQVLGLMAEVAALRQAITGAQAEEKQASGRARDGAPHPNLPLADVPEGLDAQDNVEHHRFGAVPLYVFAPQHFEVGEALGLMDFETAAKLSGSRFVVLKGTLARLERALGQFMLDVHVSEHGYTEIAPPLLVRDEVMFGTAPAEVRGRPVCGQPTRDLDQPRAGPRTTCGSSPQRRCR